MNRIMTGVMIMGVTIVTLMSGCSSDDSSNGGPPGPAASASDGPGPSVLPAKFVHAVGSAQAGQEIFRFETFGNQRFWTDAAKLPQGIAAAGITPLQALQVGLSVNFDALNAATKQALGAALQQVTNGADPNTTAFGDPAVTLSLINQNAVIGVVAFGPDGKRKALGNSGTLNIPGGDKVGLTCAACHAVTDKSVLPPMPALNTTGSIGKEIDGPTAHGLDVGKVLSLPLNTLAYYPMLEVQFESLNGATIGRGTFPGLKTTSTNLPTEAEADTYLTGVNQNGSRFYPVGQFDAFPDGIGNPLHIAPFFRTDLSAPWGIDGAIEKLEDFNNTVFTVSLDPTSLLTPNGRKFLHTVAGPAGDELADDYERVLRATGVIGPGQAATDVIPFVQAQDITPGMKGATGRRVDETKLLDLNAYLNSLLAPAAPPFDSAKAARGRELFRTTRAAAGAGCTSCHQVDPNKFVPTDVIPIETIYPGYSPLLIFPRTRPLSDIQDSGGPSPFFDDRMIVLDATRGGRGEVRGTSLVLLLDLTRKKSFLHDDSVAGANFDEAADRLLDPVRSDTAAHPFFVADAAQRSDVIEFLRSLQTDPPRSLLPVP